MNRLAIKESVISFLKENIIPDMEEYDNIGLFGAFPESSKISYPCSILSIGGQKVITDKNNGLIDYDFFYDLAKYVNTVDNQMTISVYASIDTESDMIVEQYEYRLFQLPQEVGPVSDDISLGAINNMQSVPAKQIEKDKKKLWMSQILFNIQSTEVIEEDSDKSMLGFMKEE